MNLLSLSFLEPAWKMKEMVTVNLMRQVLADLDNVFVHIEDLMVVASISLTRLQSYLTSLMT